MNTTSPFDWLKDLCTHFDWLHASAQALAEGRPLSPSSVVPDHAIGEIMRAYFRIQDTLTSQRTELGALRQNVEARDAELNAIRTEAETARRDLGEVRTAFADARRALDDRQRGWEEAEAKWHHERRAMEERISGLEHRLQGLTGRLTDHARTLNAVAADLAGSAG
jgi:predicted  nucleic acid-binding Zn-ribbon protein